MEMFKSRSSQRQIYSRTITMPPRVAIIDRLRTGLSRLLINPNHKASYHSIRGNLSIGTSILILKNKGLLIL